MNRRDHKGFFVIVDGIDGSGKSTITRTLVEELARGGRTVFDVPAWSKLNGRLPLPTDCKESDIIQSAEPTSSWIGAAIRGEFIRNSTNYPIRSVAEAFSLDRLILYERFLLPLRNSGSLIIQDRGITTSLVYQAGLPLGEVMSLTGNALALENPPDLIIIADCDPEIAAARIAARSGKDDDALFERVEILRTLAERFNSSWFRELWHERNSKLHYLSAGASLSEVQAQVRAIARGIAAHILHS